MIDIYLFVSPTDQIHSIHAFIEIPYTEKFYEMIINEE